MPKVSPIQSSFGGGEFGPLLYARVDSERYKTGLAVCKNYLPTLQGPLVRRPGSYYVAEVKDSSKRTRVIPFEFSTTQAYMLEFGDQYIRFHRNHGLITATAQNLSAATKANPVVVTYAGSDTYANGDRVLIQGVLGMTELNNREFIVANVNAGANTFELKNAQTGVNVNGLAFGTYVSGGTVAEIYEISSPYLEADLMEIKYTQSADVIYLVHPDYAPRKLSRTGHTSWTLTAISFLDGPYLSTNTTATTLTPSAATGTGITLTASATTGINDDAGFAVTDVGRLIRIREGTAWGWVRIVGWTSTTVVTADVVATLTNTSAKATWRMGLYSGTTGYPGAVTFHEDRLFFSGAAEAPQRFDGSNSGDYENFAPSDTDGTVTASRAIGFSLNANDVNVLRWMTSDEKGLLAGTVGGEWVVRPSAANEALSPTNINAKRATTHGSADIQPVQVGKSVIFVQRAGKKVRELSYFYDVDGFRAENMTTLSTHITGLGVTQIAYQKEPLSIVWFVREDGALIAMTYERDIESFKVGWARNFLGGSVDAAGNGTEVEAIAVIPSPDGTRDELWLVAKRYINGAVHRYVEYLAKVFEETDEQQDAFLVDAGLTYDAPVTITGATKANPVVITAVAHGFSNGDRVRIQDVQGMTQLNGESFTVANKATDTFELLGINGTAYTTYVSGGEVRKLVSSISGLNHLEGQSVTILADGAVLPNATVTGGSVTLSNPSGVVHLGLGYNSDGQLLRLDAGAADGTSLGKTRRTHRVGFMLHRTLGLKFGMDFSELEEITFRTSADPMTRAPGLFSGIKSETISADYDFENQICWRQDQPLPGTIQAILPQMVTQDRG